MPGLVLAAARPDLRWVFLDGRASRTEFLVDVVGRLGWADRVEVLAGRAEELARQPAWRANFDVVVARLFGPPAVTAECAAPLLRPGGRLIVSEPPDTPDDRWPHAPLARLGLVSETRVTGPPHLILLTQAQACPEEFPRRVGVPSKRPLF